MGDELSSALENKGDLNPIIETETSINRFVNFSLRLLNKKGYGKMTSQVYGIVSSLEEIGDIYKDIAKKVKHGTKYNSTHKELINDLSNFLELFKELFFDFSNEKSVDFAKTYIEIREKIRGRDEISVRLFNLNETIIKLNNYLLPMKL